MAKSKKRKGTLIAILLVVGALVYIYISKGGMNLNLQNLSMSSSNTLIQTCNQQVTDCGTAIESKYSSSLTILKTTKVNTTLGANEFLKTWAPASQVQDISYYGDSFPVVLIAARMDNSDGTKTSHVFICKSDGTLEGLSTSGLC